MTCCCNASVSIDRIAIWRWSKAKRNTHVPSSSLGEYAREEGDGDLGYGKAIPARLSISCTVWGLSWGRKDTARKICRCYSNLPERNGGEEVRMWVDASCARRSGAIVLGKAAAARDAELKPILETMWELPYREIAEELTNRNLPTPRGGDLWNAMTVMRVMKRLGIAGK
jgi:hypothetical protein